MAYKVNRKDEYVAIPDGVPSYKKLYNFNKKMQKTPEFYELEPAEVVQVLLKDEDLPGGPDNPDYSYFGAIKARPVVSGRDLPGDDDSLKAIRPLEPNIKDYPIPGEYVIVVKYFGDPTWELKNINEYFSGMYYTQKLNLFNSVNSNSFPGISEKWSPFTEDFSDFEVGEFKKQDKVRQVKAKKGDIIFHGRQGQSINFSSGNWAEITPNIKIKAGQLMDAEKFGTDVSYLDEFQKPVEEDINADGSSIWLTADPEITGSLVDLNIEFSNAENHTNMSKIHEDKGAQDGGKQIILNSDRIIFNSKLNEIFGYSALGIGWSTKKSFTVDADRKVNLNSPDVVIGKDSLEFDPSEGFWPGVITITPPGAEEGKRPGFFRGGISLGYSSKVGFFDQDMWKKDEKDNGEWTYKANDWSLSNPPALEPVVKGQQLAGTLKDILDQMVVLAGLLRVIPEVDGETLGEIENHLNSIRENLGINFFSKFVKTI